MPERKNYSESNHLIVEEANKDKENIGYLHRFKGLFAALISVILVVISATCVQLLQRKIPDFELNTFRVLPAVFVYSFVLILTKEFPVVPRSEIIATFCFSLLNIINSVNIYIAVTFIPVSSAESLRITSEIVSGIFLFAIFLEDRMTVSGVLSAALCVGGVTLVIQPEFIFTWMDDQPFNGTIYELESTRGKANETIEATNNDKVKIGTILGYILPVTAGLTVSANFLLVKKRPFLNENKKKILFWNFVLSSLISIVVMAISGETCAACKLVGVFTGHYALYNFYNAGSSAFCGDPVYIGKYFQHYSQYVCCVYACVSVHSIVIYSTWKQKLDRSCRGCSSCGRICIEISC